MSDDVGLVGCEGLSASGGSFGMGCRTHSISPSRIGSQIRFFGEGGCGLGSPSGGAGIESEVGSGGGGGWWLL